MAKEMTDLKQTDCRCYAILGIKRTDTVKQGGYQNIPPYCKPAGCTYLKNLVKACIENIAHRQNRHQEAP